MEWDSAAYEYWTEASYAVEGRRGIAVVRRPVFVGR
jgi:hypothetical protein